MPADAESTRFRRLDHIQVAATVDRLCAGIDTDLPGRSIGKVAAEVRQMVDKVADEADARRRQYAMLRAASVAFVVVIALATGVAVVLAAIDAFRTAGNLHAFDWLPLLESAINDLGFAAVAIFFLISLPARYRRRHTLHQLHELRSLAHVVDMLQLTKSPDLLRHSGSASAGTAAATPADVADPEEGTDLDGPEMRRYLDFCSQLLSLVAKIAALAAQENDDAVVLDTVSEIETLTVGISRKIWQKLSLVPLAD